MLNAETIYLQSVLSNKCSTSTTASYLVGLMLNPILTEWASIYLDEIFPSGSSAKGTSVFGKSDVDIFVSINHSCPSTLADIFGSLENKLKLHGFQVRRQNVSLGLKVHNYAVDVVPGRRLVGNTNFHNLYKSKQNSWTQTNVKGQIRDVKNSGRTRFIQLTKIWRDCHKLEFPSMNIEFAVLDALKYCSTDISLESGFKRILEYLRDNLVNAKYIDNYNSNNIISDDMYQYEKQAVSDKAKWCLAQVDIYGSMVWSRVIW